MKRSNRTVNDRHCTADDGVQLPCVNFCTYHFMKRKSNNLILIQPLPSLSLNYNLTSRLSYCSLRRTWSPFHSYFHLRPGALTMEHEIKRFLYFAKDTLTFILSTARWISAVCRRYYHPPYYWILSPYHDLGKNRRRTTAVAVSPFMSNNHILRADRDLKINKGEILKINLFMLKYVQKGGKLNTHNIVLFDVV